MKEIDPEKASLRCGGKYNEKEKKISIKCLGQEYTIHYPGGEVSFSNVDKEPREAIKIVLLHYIANEGSALKNKLISFRELPGGDAYYKAFQRWAIEPIAHHFDKKPHLFKEAVLRLKGTKVEYGDLAFCIPALPNIPLIYILWVADEEFTGACNILFDYSASSWLHTEDLAFLGEFTTEHLIEME